MLPFHWGLRPWGIWYTGKQIALAGVSTLYTSDYMIISEQNSNRIEKSPIFWWMWVNLRCQDSHYHTEFINLVPILTWGTFVGTKNTQPKISLARNNGRSCLPPDPLQIWPTYNRPPPRQWISLTRVKHQYFTLRPIIYTWNRPCTCRKVPHT